MGYPTVTQDPDERLPYSWELINYFDDDQVVTSTWEEDDGDGSLVFGDIGKDNFTVFAYIEGGTLGQTYVVKCTAESIDGKTTVVRRFNLHFQYK